MAGGRYFPEESFQLLDPEGEAQRQLAKMRKQAVADARVAASAGPAGALMMPGVAGSMLRGAVQGAARPVLQNAPVVPGFNAMETPPELPGDPAALARSRGAQPFGGLAYLTPEQAHEGASVLPFYGVATDLEQRNLGNVLLDAPELIPGAGLAAKGAGSLAPLFKGMMGVGMIGGSRGYSALNSFSPLLDAEEKLGQIRDLPRRGGERDNARRALWNELGVYEGPEGRLRFEIDDSQIKYNPAALTPYTKDGEEVLGGRLADIIEHPKLFKAYPELENLSVVMRQSTGGGLRGQASYKRWGMSSPNDELRMWTLDGKPGEWPKGNKLVSPDVDPSQQLLPGMLEPDSALKFTPEQESTLLHEVQHFVQNLESHATGGSSRYFKDTPWKTEDAGAELIANTLTAEPGSRMDTFVRGPLQREVIGDMQALVETPRALGAEVASEAEVRDALVGRASKAFPKHYNNYYDEVIRRGLAPAQLDLFARPGRNIYNRETAERLIEDLRVRYPTAHDKYENLYGEAEARMTGESRNMSALERRLSHPEDRFDRPRDRTTVTVRGSRKKKVTPLTERSR